MKQYNNDFIRLMLGGLLLFVRVGLRERPFG